MVLKQMEDADIKPDSKTFSYLIANCKCEEDIVKVSIYQIALYLYCVIAMDHAYYLFQIHGS